MNKAKPNELRPEYHREDLGPGVRGKYFESYRRERIWFFLAPMWQKHFLPKML